MDFDKTKILEKLQGKWIPYRDDYRSTDNVIRINDDRITFPTFYNGDVTKNFEIKRHGCIAGKEYYEITALGEKGARNTFLFGEEDVLGTPVDILFDTIFELDGRGLIVTVEYVLEENLDKVPADYKSNLYVNMNCRPAPSMHIDAPMGMSAPLMMGNMMALMNGTNKVPQPDENVEKVVCAACKNSVPKGNFCRECGARIK